MEDKFTELSSTKGSSKSEEPKNWYFGFGKPPTKEERIQRNEERIQRMKQMLRQVME